MRAGLRWVVLRAVVVVVVVVFVAVVVELQPAVAEAEGLSAVPDVLDAAAVKPIAPGAIVVVVVTGSAAVQPWDLCAGFGVPVLVALVVAVKPGEAHWVVVAHVVELLQVVVEPAVELQQVAV